jgi:ABC-type branched-subunit amino acid transport system ATPase component
MSNGLSVTGLAVERSGKPVIHGVDIEIAPGKITALLGANGAGKSSLVLTIAGALPAARGQIMAHRSTACAPNTCAASAWWPCPRDIAFSPN